MSGLRARELVTKLLVENKLYTAQQIIDAMIAFADEVRRAERERCAKICDDVAVEWGTIASGGYCAELIREQDDDPIQARSKPSEELFYLQDSRGFTGNDVMWWKEGGSGYTSDISKAHVYTKENAQMMNRHRGTDIAWPKDYIDGMSRPAVDHQYLDKRKAMPG